MARAFSAKAAKDYPQHGIKKGDTYWYWSFYRGPKMMSKTPPTRAQLTNSPTLSAAYAAIDDFSAAVSACETVEDLKSAVDEAASAIGDVVSEYEESISNLEDAFPNGCPALEEKNDQKDQLESFQQELESWDPDGCAPDGCTLDGWDKLNDEAKQEWLDAAKEELQAMEPSL